jgi:hypothetical protein
MLIPIQIYDELLALKTSVDALSNDPIGKARYLVSECRSSGQRRETLMWYITNGNSEKSWVNQQNGQPYQIPPRLNTQIMCQKRYTHFC